MSVLNNINGPITPINRKTISKVSLHLGECFKGELINIEGEEALILLPEGYKLRARIVGNLKEAYLSRFLFQLEDFKDGKVFLKIIHEEASEEFKGDLKNKFIREGIISEDKDMALLLLRHNIPLTKSNLSFAKSVFFLRGEVVKGEEYIDKLIDKYIQLKGITYDPLNEGEVRGKLKEAFKEIATLTEEDLIIFLENDIALSKENIVGYRKLFHSTGILYDTLKALENKIHLPFMDKEIMAKEIDTPLDHQVEANPPETTEISLKEEVNEPIGKIIKDTFTADSYHEKSVESNVRGFNNESDNNTKNIVEKTSIEVEAGEKSSEDVDVMRNKSSSIVERKEIKSFLEDITLLKAFKEEALTEIIHKGKELKEIIQKIIEEVNKGEISEVFERELDISTKDFKLLNHLSKEYYYCDIPLTIFKKEFPLKLIIKDSREGGKTLDSKELKLVLSVAAPRLGTIDGYLEIKEKSLKVNIVVPKEALDIFKISKDILLTPLKSLGYSTDVQIIAKEEGKEISPLKRFFQEDNSVLVDVLV